MADQTAERNSYIILSNFLKGPAFLHQGVTSCVFRKLYQDEIDESQADHSFQKPSYIIVSSLR